MGIQIHKVAEYGSPTLDPDPQHWVMQYAKQNVKYCYIVPGQAVTGIIFPLPPSLLITCLLPYTLSNMYGTGIFKIQLL